MIKRYVFDAVDSYWFWFRGFWTEQKSFLLFEQNKYCSSPQSKKALKQLIINNNEIHDDIFRNINSLQNEFILICNEYMSLSKSNVHASEWNPIICMRKIVNLIKK